MTPAMLSGCGDGLTGMADRSTKAGVMTPAMLSTRVTGGTTVSSRSTKAGVMTPAMPATVSSKYRCWRTAQRRPG